jgi:hypothetical protein
MTLVVAGCGGGGCEPFCVDVDIPPTTASWESQRYVIRTSPLSADPVGIDAKINVGSFGMPRDADAVIVRPSGLQINPTPGAGPWPIAIHEGSGSGTVSVRFTVSAPTGPGSYPKGEYPFTATYTYLKDVVVTTTVVVVESSRFGRCQRPPS